jgi:hypothetical protein
MGTFVERCFVMLLVVSYSLTGIGQQEKPTKILRPPGADFEKAPGQILFSPDGKLYTAYRLTEETNNQGKLRVVVFNPTTGQQNAVRDYPLPPASFPRVSTNFKVSQDGSTLVYAELHAPRVILTIQTSTLKLLSTSDVNGLGADDFAPHICEVNKNSVTLSAERFDRRGKVAKSAEFRKLVLDVNDLHNVISDETLSVERDPCEPGYWRKQIHPKAELSTVVLTCSPKSAHN